MNSFTCKIFEPNIVISWIEIILLFVSIIFLASLIVMIIEYLKNKNNENISFEPSKEPTPDVDIYTEFDTNNTEINSSHHNIIINILSGFDFSKHRNKKIKIIKTHLKEKGEESIKQQNQSVSLQEY